MGLELVRQVGRAGFRAGDEYWTLLHVEGRELSNREGFVEGIVTPWPWRQMGDEQVTEWRLM